MVVLVDRFEVLGKEPRESCRVALSCRPVSVPSPCRRQCQRMTRSAPSRAQDVRGKRVCGALKSFGLVSTERIRDTTATVAQAARFGPHTNCRVFERVGVPGETTWHMSCCDSRHGPSSSRYAFRAARPHAAIQLPFYRQCRRATRVTSCSRHRPLRRPGAWRRWERHGSIR